MLKRVRYEDPWDEDPWDTIPAHKDENALERMGKRLHDYLLQLKIMGKLTATHVTTIAYFHKSRGGRGCSRLALPALKELNNLNPDLKNASRIL